MLHAEMQTADTAIDMLQQIHPLCIDMGHSNDELLQVQEIPYSLYLLLCIFLKNVFSFFVIYFKIFTYIIQGKLITLQPILKIAAAWPLNTYYKCILKVIPSSIISQDPLSSSSSNSGFIR